MKVSDWSREGKNRSTAPSSSITYNHTILETNDSKELINGYRVEIVIILEPRVREDAVDRV